MGMGDFSIRGIHRSLDRTKRQLSRSHAKLASGERIEAAGDDPAGLALSERLRSQLASLHASSRNITNGISLANTAERGLGEVDELLGRMRELAVRAATDTLSTGDRSSLHREFVALRDEVDRIASSVAFNGTKVLDGSIGSVAIQTGPEGDDTVDVALEGASASDLGIDGAGLDDAASAAAAFDDLDAAIDSVAEIRSGLGVASNTLSSRARSLGQRELDTTATESRIRDVDVAVERARRAQLAILAQGQIALLTQAHIPNATARALVA